MLLLVLFSGRGFPESTTSSEAVNESFVRRRMSDSDLSLSLLSEEKCLLGEGALSILLLGSSNVRRFPTFPNSSFKPDVLAFPVLMESTSESTD